MAYPENTGGVAEDQLCSIVQRVERLREEIDALNKDVSEVYKEARGYGFDVRTLKALISERAKIAKDPAAYQENEALLELYRDVVNRGMDRATRARARDAAPPTDHSTRAWATPPPSPSATGDTAATVSPTHSTQDARSPAKSCAEGGASYALASPVNSDEPDLPAFLDRRKHEIAQSG